MSDENSPDVLQDGAATRELIRIVEFLSARGGRLKHEAMTLLAGDSSLGADARREGERHTRAAVLLIQAQDTLAICTELAGGTHHCGSGTGPRPSIQRRACSVCGRVFTVGKDSFDEVQCSPYCESKHRGGQ